MSIVVAVVVAGKVATEAIVLAFGFLGFGLAFGDRRALLRTVAEKADALVCDALTGDALGLFNLIIQKRFRVLTQRVARQRVAVQRVAYAFGRLLKAVWVNHTNHNSNSTNGPNQQPQPATARRPPL
jgi:hypothetical protein